MYQFEELNIENTITFQRYLENVLQNIISVFINSMEDEYLFEPDYEDSCSVVDTTNTVTMADGPPPAKKQPKANLTDAKTMADGPPPTKNKPKCGYRQCPICNEWDRNLKKHIKTHHLQTYLDPQMMCWTCENLLEVWAA